MESLLTVLWIGALLVASAWGVWLVGRRDQEARRLLDQWAGAQGLQVVDARRALMWFGPFWWRTASSHVVFRFVITEASGARRSGWARIGAWWDVVRVSDHIEVRLDEPASAPGPR